MSKNAARPKASEWRNLGGSRVANKQIGSLTEQLLGSITIHCLSLPRGKRLGLGFQQVERIPIGVLNVIVKRYMSKGWTCDFSFDEMLSLLAVATSFELAWSIIGIGRLCDAHGDCAALSWAAVAERHPCGGWA